MCDWRSPMVIFPASSGRKIVPDLLYLLFDVLGVSLEIDGMAAVPQIIAHFIAPKKHRNYKYLK